MNYQCKNCNANMVFAPDRQAMFCPYCEGEDCETKQGDESLEVCPSCGGALTPGDYKSTIKCEFCGNWIIFDKRVSGHYRPVRIMPFKIGKKGAVACMEEEFSSRFFTPPSFLSEKTLVNMKGHYVPFFLYGMKATADYACEAKRTRKWSDMSYDYTEISTYSVKRHFTAEYEGIPADASEEMADLDMDLQEPFDYSFMKEFDSKYMSGFCSEIFDKPAEELEERAREKAKKSCDAIVMESMSAYPSGNSFSQHEIKFDDMKAEYVLLPIWHYTYNYKFREYHFLVNGQNGRVIGETPVSKIKLFVYAVLCAGLWMVLLNLVIGLLGSLIDPWF